MFPQVKVGLFSPIQTNAAKAALLMNNDLINIAKATQDGVKANKWKMVDINGAQTEGGGEQGREERSHPNTPNCASLSNYCGASGKARTCA